MILNYPVINVFCTSDVSAREKLSLLVLGVYKHVGLLKYPHLLQQQPFSSNEQKITEWFSCASTSERSIFLFKSISSFSYQNCYFEISRNRSSPPEVLLGKDILKKCRRFTGEHPCRSVISINLLCNWMFILCMDVLLKICYIFSEHLFIRRPTKGCFSRKFKMQNFSGSYCTSRSHVHREFFFFKKKKNNSRLMFIIWKPIN